MSTSTEPMDYDTFMAKHGKAPVTYAVLGAHLRQIITGIGEAVRGLRANDDALKARVAVLENVAAKSVAGVRWAGTYEAGATYHSGELVTKTGLWLALKTTTAAPGSDSTAWRLIVHRKLVPTDDGR